ncbi:MAG: fibronectin-binding protein [Mycolicibacterium hassiacum]|jgi:hypothetical protein|uniref:fibronectin-binding protein n=1 Tax=Mycolicibacterium hassiacum TaxID=46351 RepID=UPI000DB8E5E9|nr:fibronectin-binding protein [Mycolicibacterium hassiacum]MBX5486283.1 fibronectin-binding protein [Mycolicibacterium hassiacum]PZN23505.1 MAG: fibronectin-binding protein [Mycolicibacterium hassiacum]
MLVKAVVRTLIATVAVAGSAVLAAPAAGAQPGGPPPCEFALAFLCHFIPMAPDLDHDVDLTQQADPYAPPPELVPSEDPNAPLPEELLVPADPCAMGCI